jgi:signal transduction histidine kinase
MDLLAEVLDECVSLEVLVQQLLLLAETDSDRLQTHGQRVDLSRVAEKALDMFAAASDDRSVTLRGKVARGVFVEGNAHHLRQLLNNLIDNAIKFTPPHGTVEVELNRSTPGDQVLLVVRDTGRGIPDEDLPHVFERFFRGDRARSHDGDTRGTGLGLSICQRVVEVHGGQIALSSRAGEGTTVMVRLPAAADAMDRPPTRPLPVAGRA